MKIQLSFSTEPVIDQNSTYSLVIARRMPLLRRLDNMMVVEISYTKRMFGFFKSNGKMVDNAVKDYDRETERSYFGDE